MDAAGESWLKLECMANKDYQGTAETAVKRYAM